MSCRCSYQNPIYSPWTFIKPINPTLPIASEKKPENEWGQQNLPSTLGLLATTNVAGGGNFEVRFGAEFVPMETVNSAFKIEGRRVQRQLHHR